MIMSSDASNEMLLCIDPRALERCYLVADILDDEEAGKPGPEYALLGLSSPAALHRVVATLLLPAQQVTRASVVQRGRDVLQMRGEIERISARSGQLLVPIVFVHRHHLICEASQIDRDFLTGAFVDQVFTVTAREVRRPAGTGDWSCACDENGAGEVRHHVAEAFSLIVNREREHGLFAARREQCASCRSGFVSELPARLAPPEPDALNERERQALRQELEAEVRMRIRRVDP
jgi:hypothetical protein